MKETDYMQMIDQEFQQVRAAARTTSINILSLRLALVDKGVCTENELAEYDKQAEETVDYMMAEEFKKMQEIIRAQYGDEAADRALEELNRAFQPTQGIQR